MSKLVTKVATKVAVNSVKSVAKSNLKKGVKKGNEALGIPGLKKRLKEESLMGMKVSKTSRSSPDIPKIVKMLQTRILLILKRGKKVENVFLLDGKPHQSLIKERPALEKIKIGDDDHAQGIIDRMNIFEALHNLHHFYLCLQPPVISSKFLPKLFKTTMSNRKLKVEDEKIKKRTKRVLERMVNKNMKVFLKDLVKFCKKADKYKKKTKNSVADISRYFGYACIHDEELNVRKLIKELRSKKKDAVANITLGQNLLHSIIVHKL